MEVTGTLVSVGERAIGALEKLPVTNTSNRTWLTVCERHALEGQLNCMVEGSSGPQKFSCFV